MGHLLKTWAMKGLFLPHDVHAGSDHQGLKTVQLTNRSRKYCSILARALDTAGRGGRRFPNDKFWLGNLNGFQFIILIT